MDTAVGVAIVCPHKKPPSQYGRGGGVHSF
jgi:hypothetical protein